MSSCSSSTKLFAVFPPATASDYVILGMNSVRPVDEVQDVIYLPASESASETTVKVCFMTRNKCFPSLLWHCWLGDRKGIWPVKSGCWFVGGDELCTTLSPPPVSSLPLMKMANPGSPGKMAIKTGVRKTDIQYKQMHDNLWDIFWHLRAHMGPQIKWPFLEHRKYFCQIPCLVALVTAVGDNYLNHEPEYK